MFPAAPARACPREVTKRCGGLPRPGTHPVNTFSAREQARGLALERLERAARRRSRPALPEPSEAARQDVRAERALLPGDVALLFANALTEDKNPLAALECGRAPRRQGSPGEALRRRRARGRGRGRDGSPGGKKGTSLRSPHKSSVSCRTQPSGARWVAPPDVAAFGCSIWTRSPLGTKRSSAIC